jgi:hypothetical protein
MSGHVSVVGVVQLLRIPKHSRHFESVQLLSGFLHVVLHTIAVGIVDSEGSELSQVLLDNWLSFDHNLGAV